MHYIEFPKLNIHLNIDPVAINIGNIDVHWYGIIISFAVFLGFFLAIRKINSFGYSEDDVTNIITIAIPSAVIGARIYYVAFNFDAFSDDLLSIFNIRTGGLAIYGAIIGAFISVYCYCKIKKYKFLNIVDVLIPYLALGQAIGRWGNFTNQEAFGINTNLPWGMTGDIINQEISYLSASGVSISQGIPVHPTFLYEFVVNLTIFFILLKVRKNKKFDGNVLYVYLTLYGIARFFIEGLRIDSLMFLGFRVSQILSLVIVLLCLGLYAITNKKRNIEQI